MFQRTLKCWLFTVLVSAAPLYGCSSDEQSHTTNPENTGTVGLDLQVSDGVALDTVHYVITGPDDFKKSGSIDLSHSNTLTGRIEDIPLASGYTIKLDATGRDDSAICTAEETFDILETGTITLAITLRCKLNVMGTSGDVRIEGTVNVCPVIERASAPIDEIHVGAPLPLSGKGYDSDAGPEALSYSWEASSGTFNDTNAANPIFSCTEVGTTQLTLTLSDGDSCPAEQSFEVICSEPPTEVTYVTAPEFHTMEQGTIWSADGTNGSSSTRIRLASHADIDSSWKTLEFAGGADLDITIFAFDENDSYLAPSTGWKSLATPYIYSIPAGAAKLSYVLRYQPTIDIVPNARSPWVYILVHSLVDDEPSDIFPYPDAKLSLINHRGLAPGYPENTLIAFANAVERGVDAIEIDLRPTLDEHVIVLHDSTVDRTTNGTGSASSFTLSEIKELDAGSYVGPEFADQRIPTFEEALQAVQGTPVKLLLDIKVEAVIPQVVGLVESYDMVDQMIVGPRSVAGLNDFKALNPGLTTLGFIGGTSDVDAFVEAGVDIIRWWPDWIRDEVTSQECRDDYAARVAAYELGERATPGARGCTIERLAALGVPVWSTTNDLGYEGMLDLATLGVSGMLSDVPAELGMVVADIEAARVQEAEERLEALETAVAELPDGTGDSAASFIAVARTKLVDGDIGSACAVISEAAISLSEAGQDEVIALHVRDLERVAPVLACSRF